MTPAADPAETDAPGVAMQAAVERIVVLGIGNVLLSDDGIGIHVLRQLDAEGIPEGVALRDGGTIGLTLLAGIDATTGLIAVDAMEMGAPPGTLQVHEGAAMTAVLQGARHSAHEVALSDLIQAADLSGMAPARRALVAIQPETTGWGLQPTETVSAAIQPAAAAVRNLVRRWHDDRREP
ncbi:hydrogenase maturation protease [Acidimangrovimonas sediminis]|uniref:hydrogenase maturation protease n=1 Tax=Acidimangrovimonas sediminis TaxID=2056283 RepID=UPI0018EBC7DC|nr:hydrogenase maturation protease [Acidimangrovimonas sediminis]